MVKDRRSVLCRIRARIRVTERFNQQLSLTSTPTVGSQSGDDGV